MYICTTCVQERTVRLFGRGDLNSYKDELRFLLVLASCCRGAMLPATLQPADLDRHRSTYLSLLTDVDKLITAVRSQSVDAVFRPATQSRLREDSIELVRRYVAARWLRRVLTGNSFPVDDMQHTDGDMLDASQRWCWLRDFVNVL